MKVSGWHGLILQHKLIPILTPSLQPYEPAPSDHHNAWSEGWEGYRWHWVSGNLYNTEVNIQYSTVEVEEDSLTLADQFPICCPIHWTWSMVTSRCCCSCLLFSIRMPSSSSPLLPSSMKNHVCWLLFFDPCAYFEVPLKHLPFLWYSI